MMNNIKIIQDISLLYELSLSVGTSLDPHENCHHFLRTLISRKSLNFGAVWLHKTTPEGVSNCDLFYIHPNFRQDETNVTCNHYILNILSSRQYLTISSKDPHFADVMHEKKVGAGSYAIFNMEGIGFLKLFASNRPDGFPETEMAQLKQVVDKLKVSLDGCFAHIRLREETGQRMLAQRALQDSENKLRRIIDSSLDAVVSVDGAGLTQEWNLQAERMFGYTREEALGMPLADLIIPERHRKMYRDTLQENMRATISQNVNERYEIKCIKKNGQEFPAELSISINTNDKNLLFVGFLRDITEQRRAKQEIERSRNRLENLIINLQAGILLEDSQRKVALVNQAFCDMFWIPAFPEQLVGADCAEAAEQVKGLFTLPEAFIAGISRNIEAKSLVENEMLGMTDGRVLERDYIPLFSGDKYDGHLWQYRDVTERQLAEQAIRASEEKYRGILENMELGLLEVDLQQNILRTNNAFCQMMGYRQEELLGKNAAKLLLSPEFQDLVEGRNEERIQGVSSVYELQIRKKDGTFMWGLISGAPIKNSQGEVIGSIGIHFDLTERKKLENALAEAKMIADRARAAERQFLAHMSHEIRTPINAVIGMTHLLLDTQPTPTQMEYLQSLRFAADSLLGIIDNILDLSKIDAGEIEFEHKTFDLAYLIRSLVQAFQFKTEEKDIVILEKLDPALSNLVVGDPTRLNQILTNLLGNAIKFTEKGKISLATKVLHESSESYSIEFRVCDTGIGIPADKLETIFEYFKQADVKINRKFGGTGLGLTIVKQLIEKLGGSIRVESKYGEGADFIFMLPLGNSGIPAQSLKYAKQQRSKSSELERIYGMNFLVVEDNHLNQKLLCKTLDIWNCMYDVAKDGEEALEKTAATRYDAILMDIHMPGMDGFEATSIIRNSGSNPNRQTPIIALTAAAMLEDKKRSFEVGMNGFLTKPIAPKMLIDELLRTIQRHRLSGKAERGNQKDHEFDLNYLMEISHGDTVFVHDMVNSFLQETPIVLDKLTNAAQSHDLASLYTLLHTLRPNLGMLGLKGLQIHTEELKMAVKEGRLTPDNAATQITRLVSQIQATLRHIENNRIMWEYAEGNDGAGALN